MQADGTEDARVALRAIYARADEEASARPELACELSGRCCRFAQHGHELFLTRLEVDEMVAWGGARPADPERCPWLDRGLCQNRAGRALACRTYFCSDEASAAEVTERFHAAIRALHEEHGIPYEYRSLFEHMNSGPPTSSKSV